MESNKKQRILLCSAGILCMVLAFVRTIISHDFWLSVELFFLDFSSVISDLPQLPYLVKVDIPGLLSRIAGILGFICLMRGKAPKWTAVYPAFLLYLYLYSLVETVSMLIRFHSDIGFFSLLFTLRLVLMAAAAGLLLFTILTGKVTPAARAVLPLIAVSLVILIIAFFYNFNADGILAIFQYIFWYFCGIAHDIGILLFTVCYVLHKKQRGAAV